MILLAVSEHSVHTVPQARQPQTPLHLYCALDGQFSTQSLGLGQAERAPAHVVWVPLELLLH